MEKRMVSYPYPNQNIVSSILDDVLRSVSDAPISLDKMLRDFAGDDSVGVAIGFKPKE